MILLKLIFAVGVVAIHTKVLNGADTTSWLTLHVFFRLGVPFFFCVSGFFLYRAYAKSDNVNGTTVKYLKRLVIPLIF